MEPHYLSLLYHACYLPPCMWVTHCSPSRLSISSFRLSRLSLSILLCPCDAASRLLPLSPPRGPARIALSRYRPSFVARLEAVSLGIYLATFVERMLLPLARVQPWFSGVRAERLASTFPRPTFRFPLSRPGPLPSSSYSPLSIPLSSVLSSVLSPVLSPVMHAFRAHCPRSMPTYRAKLKWLRPEIMLLSLHVFAVSPIRTDLPVED